MKSDGQRARATGDEQRAMGDERRATGDERRATGHKRRVMSDERRARAMSVLHAQPAVQGCASKAVWPPSPCCCFCCCWIYLRLRTLDCCCAHRRGCSAEHRALTCHCCMKAGGCSNPCHHEREDFRQLCTKNQFGLQLHCVTAQLSVLFISHLNMKNSYIYI